MPGNYTYPGVYVEEIPSGVHTIVGVSTSDTAFVDFFERGPIDKVVRITGFTDFERIFGGFDERSEASFAIYQYFLNGGSIAWVVRVVSDDAVAAARTLVASGPGTGYRYGYGDFQETFRVYAASPGKWGNNLQVAVDYKGTKRVGDQPLEFNLVVREVAEVNGRSRVLQTEVFRNLSPNKLDKRYAVDVVNNESSLIRLEDIGIGELPEATGNDVIGKPDEAEFLWLGSIEFWNNKQMRNAPKPEWEGKVKFEDGFDGTEPGAFNWFQSYGSKVLRGGGIYGPEEGPRGIYMLETIAPFIFNILCLPAVAYLSEESQTTVWAEAARFCELKRAFLIIDIPPTDFPSTYTPPDILIKSPANMIEYISGADLPATNHAAVYYPRLTMADPLNENRPREIGPSGTVAGIYARTDAQRGVWKAPAGTEATMFGVQLLYVLTDLENGGLNPLGANVSRNFPIYRNVVWGARTLEGADQQASEWKYVPVRRMALFLEESLYQGLKWVVFEPNDEPLWASIRLNVGAFMQSLFRQGAFQGKTPREAYFVKCDKETTTQTDINNGIVNIVVGFAPLKPAEFVVIKIQQMAGEIPT